MTHDTKRTRTRAAVPAAALAALLLAGCSTGHIGESWQCPLADAGTCDSVAAADPAVPDMNAARNAVLAEPLCRVRASDRLEAAAETPCATACGDGFDPVGWLIRLFETEDGERGAPPAGESARAPSAAAQPAGEGPDKEAAAPAAARTEPPEPPTLPAEAGPGQHDLAQGGPAAADLRTGEVVARIWIAPFVDADGVYREASHVRAVLEPAGWRLK